MVLQRHRFLHKRYERLDVREIGHCIGNRLFHMIVEDCKDSSSTSSSTGTAQHHDVFMDLGPWACTKLFPSQGCHFCEDNAFDHRIHARQKLLKYIKCMLTYQKVNQQALYKHSEHDHSKTGWCMHRSESLQKPFFSASPKDRRWAGNWGVDIGHNNHKYVTFPSLNNVRTTTMYKRQA